MGTQRHSRALAALVIAALAALSGAGHLRAQVPRQGDRPPLVAIGERDVREWLTMLSSDAMQGRAAFSTGFGLAAGYVSEQLRKIGATPLGIDGTYLQPVNRWEYRVMRRSSIRVEVGGETRRFEQGEHVSFPAMAGSRQTLEFTGVDFVGYGMPDADPDGQSAGRLVVLLGGLPPGVGTDQLGSPALASAAGRAEMLARQGAGAVIAFGAVPGDNGRGSVNLTTVQAIDRPRPPVVTADREFLSFLLTGAPVPFEELRGRASRNERLDRFTLPDVRVRIEIDHEYDLVSVDRSHNVVALIPGADPAFRDSYVLFGAHLDHVGMASGGAAPGRVNTSVDRDPIWNGADDDGSGSVAVLAIAKAMAEGPRPRRPTLFVWHTAEEEGLLGSAAMVDDPIVPLSRIVAVFNIDMIGRNRNDDADEADTVYVVGADRISTDLHNRIEQVNEASDRPLTIDYFYNDPRDRESFYTRSDHYSYASQGIPVAFFFTGTHPDYHANTDTVDKILFPKLVRITQLIHGAGFAVADEPDPPGRDNRGPRAGRGFRGPLEVR